MNKETTSLKARELPLEALRWRCDPAVFSFETTSEIAPVQGILGQDRAARALQFGLTINHPGYNIYVAGLAGTGKTSICRNFCLEQVRDRPVPDDWCYVHNFSDSDRPVALRLPAGRGKKFREDMAELLQDLRIEIPKAFEGEEFEKRRTQIVEERQTRQQTLYQELEKDAKAEGFAIQGSQQGLLLVPMLNDLILSEEQYNALDPEVREAIEKKRMAFNSRLAEFVKQMKQLEKKMREKARGLQREVGFMAVGTRMEEIREAYQEFPEILNHLKDIQESMLSHLEDFRREAPEGAPPQAPEGDSDSGPDAPQFPFMIPRGPAADPFVRYEVNLFVDNSGLDHAPVIVETNPTFQNLFGNIEKKAVFGTYVTDVTMIKAGSVSRANGGYLILNALDVLINPGVWNALKRTLKTEQVTIEELGETMGLFSLGGPKPTPIPTQLKVVMVGNPDIYQLLYQYEDDFRKIFKVKADFDTRMERSQAHLNGYAAFIAAQCDEKGLCGFHREAVARIVEYAARTVDDQKKLSTRFSEILDLLWESHYWAEQASSSVVRAEDVQRAIDERRIRSNLTEERLQEFITDGIILVDIEGEKVGQINGLAVYDLGDYRFGKPSRITVETYMGEEGVINIERESKLSGRIHDKGVLILSGYLGGKYGSGRPMSVSASLCFEQSYEGIEGDSASSTELYALLSSLSGLPMRQGIAVTGSVNQKGEIQPIGGVNEKVEGFFDVCKAKGLTGDQGVLIPHQNIPHLMLRDDVVEAVAAGQFHVYPVSTVDGGIEVLTGTPAGKMEPDGNFTEGSVHDRVNRRFQELAEGLREFGRAGAPAPHAQEEEEEAAARSEDFPEDEPDLPAIIPDEEDEGF